ncbi:MAG: hypothetical protein HC804_14680 [Anaerolineae bacterium]|nr:hypothetical protein [Anaerolineae bacterium]
MSSAMFSTAVSTSSLRICDNNNSSLMMLSIFWLEVSMCPIQSPMSLGGCCR